MKRRRMLNAAVLALAAWPPMLAAQAPPRTTRVAFLLSASPNPFTTRDIAEPFVQGLGAAGFVEGRNLVIDTRWAEGKTERLPGLLAEQLALRPDMILAAGPAPAPAAKAATSTVPIVAVLVDNPMSMGLVPSMARPGGNITGISSFGGELVARRLQLLKDFVPQGQRFAVLGIPNYLGDPTQNAQAA
jgi:putative ABC transport system substrate-binding protein